MLNIKYKIIENNVWIKVNSFDKILNDAIVN